jgi:hypothetical protein
LQQNAAVSIRAAAAAAAAADATETGERKNNETRSSRPSDFRQPRVERTRISRDVIVQI